MRPSVAAWTAARWIGPGRGYIDPVKEAQASAMRMDNLTSTMEMEAADQGLDHIDLLDQAEREQMEMRARGLTRRSAAGKPDSSDGQKDDGQKDDGSSPPRDSEK